MRMPPNRSVRLEGLTREYALRHEGSPRDAPGDGRISRISCSNSQATACFESCSGH